MLTLNLKTIRDGVILPKRATKASAGYDIYAPDDGNIVPGEQSLIKLGFTWNPCWCAHNFGGFFAKIFDRSGLAVKKKLVGSAGVIDSDYSDEWGLVIANRGHEIFSYTRGDRLAQFVILPFLVARDEDPPEKVREGGYGSTGK